MTLLANAESEGARITQALNSTNQNPPQVQELNKQLEIATKQIADARVAHENSQKSLGDLKTATEKSGALLTASEAELVKLKASIEIAQKTLQTSKDTVAQLETARVAAAEAARKETEALQSTIAQATSALITAKAESADLQTKLDKTEKFSDAFKEMTGRLEAANKQVAVVRVPADHDRKEVGDLQAAVDKIAASVAAADAEGAKAIATMAKSDPSYQTYQALEKQLESANQKASDAKAQASKARQDLAAAQTMVAQIRVAQAHAVLAQARESLATVQRQYEEHLGAIAAAEEEIKAAQAKVQSAGQEADLVRTSLKQAGRAGDQVKAGKNLLKAAQSKLAELSSRIKSLNESLNRSVVKLQTAKAAVSDSTPRLAAEKARVEKLTADYLRLKPAPDRSLADARR
jgi:chromosome segregation ATPase